MRGWMGAVGCLVMLLSLSLVSSGQVPETEPDRLTLVKQRTDAWLDIADGLGDGRGMAAFPAPQDDLATLLLLDAADTRAVEQSLHPAMRHALAWLVSAQQADVDGETLAMLASDLAPVLALPMATSDHEGSCMGGQYDRAAICFGTSDGETLDGDDWYQFGGPGAIFIDPGGDDTYEVTQETPSLGARYTPKTQDVLASDPDDPLASPTKTSLAATVGIFIDQGGDDTYRGQTYAFGANGGLFIDEAGDDSYTDADLLSQVTRGHSFGAHNGVFIDRGGHDDYLAHMQSFGIGSGWFIDEDGWDTYGPEKDDMLYDAFGTGDGVFIDRHGDDQYYGKSSSFADGGTFIDLRGDDVYQGSQSNFATGRDGYFLDGNGDDTYSLSFPAVSFPINVPAFAAGGVFVELDGDDRYETNHAAFALNGGTFVDVRGDDVMSAGAKSFGYSGGAAFYDLDGDDVRSSPEHAFAYGEALFLDAAGDDEYVSGDRSFGVGYSNLVNVAAIKSVSANPPADPSAGPNVGFYDIGGEDEYAAGAESFGTYRQGIFFDSEGTGSQNDVFVVAGQEAAGPSLASPMPDLWPVVDERFQLHAPSQTLRVAIDQAATVMAEGGADVPFGVEMTDDAGDAPEEGRDFGPFMAGSNANVEATFRYATEGIRFVRVAVTDAAGLHAFERAVVGPIIVDGTPPDVALAFDDGSQQPSAQDWHSESSLAVRIEAQDQMTDVEAIYAAVDQAIDVDQDVPLVTFGAQAAPTGSATFDLATVGEGVHEVNVAAVDSVGNVGEATMSVRVDRTAPTHAVALTHGIQGQNGWYAAAPRVEVSWNDTLSGLGRMEATIANTTTNATAATVPLNASLPDGVHVLALALEDVAHPPNVAIVDEAARIRVDGTPPTVTINETGRQVPVDVDVSADDATSGVARVEHRVYRAERDPSSSPWTVGPIRITSPGLWIIEARALDRAGNLGEARHEIDATALPPVASFDAPAKALLTGDPIRFTDRSEGHGTPITHWQWDFGDGNTSTDQEPSHAYADDGIYNVTLRIQNAFNQTAATSTLVEVLNRAPTAAISGTGQPVYAGFEVRLRATAADADGSVVSYQWRVDGVDVGTGDELEHAFSEGPHDVELIVSDDDGAYGNATVQVEADPVPDVIARFSGPSSAQVHEVMSFQDTSAPRVGSITAWQWSVDGVAAGTDETFEHAFTDPGDHTLRLDVTTEDGRTASVERLIEAIAIPPVASILVAGDGMTGSAHTFTSTSTHPDPARVITSHAWMLGDGTTATGASTSHVFDDDGVYEVLLRVTDDAGTVAEAMVDVTIANRAPTIIIDAPDEVVAGQTFDISAAASDLDGVVTVAWELPAGPATGDAVTTMIGSPGEHVLRAVATDDDGAVSSVEHTVSVVPDPPLASFTWSPAQPMSGENVQFTATTSDPDGDVVSQEWTIDGEPQGSSLTHRFALPGTYEVALQVTDDHGATTTVTHQVTIGDRPPVVAFSPPAPTPSGDDITFQANAADPDGEVASWSWDMGDGTTLAGASATHQYTSPGTFTVVLTVTDTAGQAATATHDVEITNHAPTVSIDAPAAATQGEELTLIATAMDEEDAAVEIHWTIGEATYTGGTIQHAFSEPGEHTVQVVAIDSHGAEASAQVDVLVAEPEETVEEETTEQNATAPPQDTAVGEDAPAAWFLAPLALLWAVRRRR